MRLLFDQNLSFRLCTVLADVFPGSSQVHLLGLEGADDRTLWDHARVDGYTIVSQDSDFAELAAILGPPPKVVWLRLGNQPTAAIASHLRRRKDLIAGFVADETAACLEVY